MAAKISISFHNVDHSEALEKRVQTKIERLLKKYPFLEKVRVTIECPHHHKHKGNLYQPRIDLHVPRQELIVGKLPGGEIHAHESPYAAINFALKAADHKLKKYADKLHKKIKIHEEPLHGEIISLGENYGHIKASSISISNIYFHKNALIDSEFEELHIGEAVHFMMHEELAENPHAIFVKVVSSRSL